MRGCGRRTRGGTGGRSVCCRPASTSRIHEWHAAIVNQMMAVIAEPDKVLCFVIAPIAITMMDGQYPRIRDAAAGTSRRLISRQEPSSVDIATVAPIGVLGAYTLGSQPGDSALVVTESARRLPVSKPPRLVVALATVVADLHRPSAIREIAALPGAEFASTASDFGGFRLK